MLRKPPPRPFLEATSAMNSIAELPGVKREQLHFLSGTWERFFWSQSFGVRWDWLPMFHEKIVKLCESITIFIFKNATKLEMVWHFCFVRSDLAEFFCVWSWDWLDILCKGHDVEIMDGKLFGLNPWGCECHRWCGHPWVVSPYQRN